jgi:GAF domain-containing protein
MLLRKAQLARDVDQTHHYKNPSARDQPELALPLIAAEQVIGVLDVQSQMSDAFDQENIAILQVMADQLAIAIQNARLLQEVRNNLYELQAAYGRIERQEWTRLAQTGPVIGFEYNGIEITPISTNSLPPHSRSGSYSTSLEQGNPLPMDANDPSMPPNTSDVQAADTSESQNDVKPISIPLRVRGERIGSLDAWPQTGEWSEAEVNLLTTISNRLSQVLEGARLLQQAQNLASREQQINYIANQMRSAGNLDSILKNTVRELGKALGTRRAYIQLGDLSGTTTADALRVNPEEADGLRNTAPKSRSSGVSQDGR